MIEMRCCVCSGIMFRPPGAEPICNLCRRKAAVAESARIWREGLALYFREWRARRKSGAALPAEPEPLPPDEALFSSLMKGKSFR